MTDRPVEDLLVEDLFVEDLFVEDLKSLDSWGTKSTHSCLLSSIDFEITFGRTLHQQGPIIGSKRVNSQAFWPAFIASFLYSGTFAKVFPLNQFLVRKIQTEEIKKM